MSKRTDMLSRNVGKKLLNHVAQKPQLRQSKSLKSLAASSCSVFMCIYCAYIICYIVHRWISGFKGPLKTCPVSRIKITSTSYIKCNFNKPTCRSQWPCGLRRRSTAARLLRSWVRIPPRAWMFVCCQVDVSATDWSFVQRNPTDCGASLYVIKKKPARGL